MSIHINKQYFIIQQQHKALTIMIFTSSVPLAASPWTAEEKLYYV